MSDTADATPRPRSTLREFLHSEAAGGILLMVAAALAMLVANLPGLSADYFHLLHAETGPVLSPRYGPMTVHLWINDAAMALFFLLVGLEIKREFVSGRLASWERRRLPVVAAAAGMAVPALLYLLVAGSRPAFVQGWAIPAATDIAFAIGVLAILGKRAPTALKLFLTTVAIVDDLGAVVIIALFYTAQLDLIALALAAGVLLAMFALNRRGVRRLSPYLLLAALLWVFVFRSGIHATIAGVAAALMIPIAPQEADSPLHTLEHRLHPWSAFLVVPLFGFANAGVSLAGVTPAVLLDPLPLGVAFGLFFGKQIGIFGAILLAHHSGFAKRPGWSSWPQVYGASLLAGIGFTMSLFIGALAFPGQEALIDRVKLGVLAGSLLSALAGYLVLRFAPGPRTLAARRAG